MSNVQELAAPEAVLPINNHPKHRWCTMDQGDRIESALSELRDDFKDLKELIDREEGAKPERELRLKAVENRMDAFDTALRALSESYREALGATKTLKWIAGLGGGSGLAAAMYQAAQLFGGG